MRARSLVAAALAAAALTLAGCLTPAQSLLFSLIPDGTFTTLLSNLQGVDQSNRKQLSDLEQKGDWAGIVRIARQNIAKDPSSADWWIVEGYAHSQMKAYARAAEAFQEAVRLEPTDMDGWNLLGQTYRAMGQPERAIRTLDAALRINQQSPLTYYFIAESYGDLKRYDRAVDWYQQALRRDPQFVEAWYGLAVANARLGRREDFEDAVNTLRTFNPQLADQLVAAMPR